MLLRAVAAYPLGDGPSSSSSSSSSRRKRTHDFESEGRWIGGQWVGSHLDDHFPNEEDEDEELFVDPPSSPGPSSSSSGARQLHAGPAAPTAAGIGAAALPAPLPTPPPPSPELVRVQLSPRHPHDLTPDQERRRAPAAPRGWHLDDWEAELQRRKDDREREGVRRQSFQGAGTGPINQGYPACNNVGNDVLSCFPEDGTTMVEDTWSRFVWNRNFPSFINDTGTVDVYLFNANTLEVASQWLGANNNEGSIGVSPVGSWFPDEDEWELGGNVSIPYYFVVVPGGQELTGGEAHQATFTVVQTAPPPSLSASVAAASAASVASSRASVLSEASSLGLTLTTSLPSGSVTVLQTTNAEGETIAVTMTGGQDPLGTNNPGGNPDGGDDPGLQNGGQSDNFPDWAIAVIVILGFFALLAAIVAAYFFIKFMRRRSDARAYRHSSAGSSLNSASPMVQRQAEGQGLLTAAAVGGAGAGAAAGAAARGSDDGHAMSEDHHGLLPPAVLGARQRHGSGASRGSATRGLDLDEDGRPFTGSDAAMMADAFRKALRKPDFVNTDPSPGSTQSGQTPGTGGASSSQILGGMGGNAHGSEPQTAAAESFPGMAAATASHAPESEPLHGQHRQSHMAELIGEESPQPRPNRDSGASSEPPQIGHDDEEQPEVRELMEKELASEGRSVTSVRDRRRLEVTQPDTDA